MNVHVRSAGRTVADQKSRVLDFVGLMKLRLNLLVLGAVATGYVLGAEGGVALGNLFPFLLGVLLTGGGSSAINMALEADRDRLMERTRNRPVAAGRLAPDDALGFGIALSVTGVVLVALVANPIAAGLTAATVLLYTLAYTPLKTRSTLNTWVGAVAGALPPLIGWAAAAGGLSAAATPLFAIVFLWQFPHFFAIASLYREQYRRAGMVMLPVVDEGGLRTAHNVMVAAMAFVPVSLLPSVVRIAGSGYFVGAFGISLAYLVFSVRASVLRTDAAWRDLLRVSLVCLPALFVLMIADRLPL